MINSGRREAGGTVANSLELCARDVRGRKTSLNRGVVSSLYVEDIRTLFIAYISERSVFQGVSQSRLEVSQLNFAPPRYL